MKKIVSMIWILLVVFVPALLFAKTTVSLQTNGTAFDINTPITLQISIIPEWWWQVSIKWIQWLSWFQIIGQNQSQSYQNINGKTSAQIDFILTIKADTKWDYELWPAIIQDGNQEVSSNTVRINVTWAQIFMGNANAMQTPPPQQPNVLPVQTNTSGQLSVTNSNEDIKDIKPNLQVTLLHYFVTFIIIIIFIGITYWYRYSKKKKSLYHHKEIIQEAPKPINYKSLITSVEKKYLDAEKALFYAKLWSVFRLYVKHTINPEFDTKTFHQAKHILDQEMLDLLKKIYYPEYNTEQDSKEQRKKIIKELLSVCV